jgi:N-methylhydantoinase A
MTHLVGIDIGGTFTDVVTLDVESGRLHHAKRPSDPQDLVRGIRQALIDDQVPLDDVAVVRHGTTVVINALLQRVGARTALVTTKGFRDVLEIGRTNWPEPYNLFWDRDPILVPRELRFEADERMGAGGVVVQELDRQSVTAAAAAIAEQGVESIAVCLMHSYASPQHEIDVARILREELPGVEVSVSHELSQEFREYERTSTVVMNAYVKPVVDRYLQRLQDALAADGFTGSLYLMESSGGVTSVDDARARPIVLVESGPAAGAIAVAEYARRLGIPKAIAFDMGGTTAKGVLVEDGEPLFTAEYYVPTYERGFPIQVAAVDIVEVGTGGGSIAALDDVGALSVGPRSAGAVPGPACYGNGGENPTVTDANLLLGRLNPDAFLSGELSLDVGAAKDAMANIGTQADEPTEELAAAVVRLADFSMASAIRKVSLERGRDPRDFVLFAYGGGGGMHAASLARELAIPTVIVPPMPGVFSAVGMLLADLRHDFGATVMLALDAGSADALEAAFRDVEGQADRWRERAGGGGDDARRTLRYADCRYAGQEFTIVVAADVADGDPITVLRERFEAEYERRYGHSFPDLPVEVVNARAVTYVDLQKPDLGALGHEVQDGETTQRDVYFDGHGFLPTAVHQRAAITPETTIAGPAIVEEYGATTVINPGDTCRMDINGLLVISIGSDEAGSTHAPDSLVERNSRVVGA